MNYLNTCKKCNKEWSSSHPADFCSSLCNHVFKKSELRKSIDLNKTCIECAISFEAKRTSTRFCSSSCNNTHWFRNNRAKHNFKEAKRRAAKLNATPSWLSSEDWAKIKEIYETCPEGYHVDHIIPLQGKEVSGLHVPWNLQHLTADDNLKKGRKV